MFWAKTQYGYKVDIWALGILLYKLLEAKTPFKGSSETDLHDNLNRGDYILST